jgi:DNA-binding LytR/AlgR family response regulator
VRARDGLRLIPVDEILYFIAEQKYTTLRHLAGEELIEESLKSLEEEFVRLRGGATLPVSRRLATEVLRRVSR